MTTNTDVRFVDMMIIKVVGIRLVDGDPRQYMVLDEIGGGRRLAVQIGLAEAITLASTVEGVDLERPQGPHLTASVIHALGGRVGRVRIDAVVDDVYMAKVELDGPHGDVEIDARPSDALNLAALAKCPISVATDVLEEAAARRNDSTADAELLRLASEVPPMGLTRRGPLGASDSFLKASPGSLPGDVARRGVQRSR